LILTPPSQGSGGCLPCCQNSGQEVFRVSIYHDDPSKDVLLGVVIDGKRQMIQYSPAKQLMVSQYQATIDGNAALTCTPF
jgi:hypothetical protein